MVGGAKEEGNLAGERLADSSFNESGCGKRGGEVFIGVMVLRDGGWKSLLIYKQ